MSDFRSPSFEALINDILLLDDIMLSVRNHGAIAEFRVDKNTPFSICEQWAIIGNEHAQWHIHINYKETKEAKFIIEEKENGRKSYSIRIFNFNDELILRINFLKMYTAQNVIEEESLSRYETLFSKYGKNDTLILAN